MAEGRGYDLLHTKAEKALRIFISYGHPEAEICRRIRKVLLARGHKVWLDTYEIKAGDDWRRSITEGIRDSQSVLSMLSKYSVRDPGVCLDEMRIAIGIKGGNIRTILLEPEKKVKPPATLSDRQWLDMSEWKEKKEDRAWFDEKMIQLISAIESPENVRFEGEIDLIRGALPNLRHDTSKQNALLQQPFYGRKWLLEKIDDWRMDPRGARMCILYGDPGIGKSSFMAHYMHYFESGAAAFFCEYSKAGSNDPRAVVQTLAYLLACRFPDYRLLLCDILANAPLSSMNASEQFDLLLANPFSSIMIDGDRGAQCILIDGLDECGSTERNVLTEVLVQYAQRLPHWLRILASSRRVAAVTGPAAGAFHIDMNGDDRKNIRDVEEYLRAELYPETLENRQKSEAAVFAPEKVPVCRGQSAPNDLSGQDMVSEKARICSALAEKSGGIFLYAVMIVDAVRQGKLDPADLQGYPEGLGGAFFSWFRWLFPERDAYEEIYEPVLSMILSSPEPIPADEIALAMNWTRRKTGTVLRRFSVLLKIEKKKERCETVSFSHKFIADWICSHEAGMWQADPADGAERLADTFSEICREWPEDLTDYEAMWLRTFLEESGRRREARRLKGNTGLLRRLLDAGIRCRYAEDHEKALRYLQEAALLSVDIQETSVNDLDVNPELADALQVTGEVFRELGTELENSGNAENLEGALIDYDKYLQAASRLYSSNESEKYALLYARALGCMGDAYRKYGTKDGLQKSITWYQKRETLLKTLLDRQPSEKVRSDVYTVCWQFMKTYMELGGEEDHAKALAYAEMCIEQAEHLNDGKTSDSLSNRGFAYLWKGGVLYTHAGEDLQQLTAVEKDFLCAVNDFEQAVRREPSLKNCHSLGIGLFRLGEVYGRFGTQEKYRMAVETYTRCRALGKELWEKSHTPDRLRELALACRALGRSFQLLGGSDSLYRDSMHRDSQHRDSLHQDLLCRAKSCFEESLQYSEQLTAWVDTIQYRRDLAISHGRMGEILELTACCAADLQDAFAHHQTCLQILREIPFQRQLGSVQRETMACEERIGDFLERHPQKIFGEETAADHYKAAISLLQKSDLPQKAEMIERIQKKLE